MDTKNKAIGLSHSGWRGTVGKIGKVTIEKMGELYGTKPEDIVACIGPSICQKCYEISEEVVVQFKEAFLIILRRFLLIKAMENISLICGNAIELILKKQVFYLKI